MIWLVLGGIGALALGIWIGLGWPGLKFGREDRVVRGKSLRSTLPHQRTLDWLRPNKREIGGDRKFLTRRPDRD